MRTSHLFLLTPLHPFRDKRSAHAAPKWRSFNLSTDCEGWRSHRKQRWLKDEFFRDPKNSKGKIRFIPNIRDWDFFRAKSKNPEKALIFIVWNNFNSHAVAVRYSLRRRCVPLRYIFSFNSLSIFYFSRIKSVITSLLRNSLRFSWWSPFVCRSIIRGPRVPKRMVYFRENLEHEIRGYWWLNPKVSVQV